MRRQTHYLSPKLAVEPMPEKDGFGVVAKEPIAAGETVVVWGGRIFDRSAVAQMDARERIYVLQVEEDLFLAADGPVEPAEYVNHSCNPNVGVHGQMALVALRDIAVGEEICFDYAMSESNEFTEFACACGAPNCRGKVGGDDWRRPELQRRYAGFFSPYLQRKIDAMVQRTEVPGPRRRRAAGNAGR